MKPLTLFRDAVRAKEIVAVLVRHGFFQLVQDIGAPASWLRHLVPGASDGRTLWQRIRAACEDLGPTFVKIGQILGTRQDVLPAPLIEELRGLRERVRPLAFAEMRPILDEEMERPLSECFSEFEENPVACGSLGQVYRARLRDGGKEVAVKVQRPGIRRAVEADLDMLRWLAVKLDDLFPELKPYGLPEVVESLHAALTRELDYEIEANNAAVFNATNPMPDLVFAPQVHPRLTTSRVLVTDWVEGVSVARASFPAEEGKRLAEAAARSLFSQIVVAGFFHADPHAGNVFLASDRRLCLIDWGMTGQLTREMRYNLADLVDSVASRDPEKVVRVAARMARYDRPLDSQRLEQQITQVLQTLPGVALPVEAVGRLMLRILFVFGTNGILVSRDYTLLCKAVISIEETGITLDPAFDLSQVAKPYLEQLAWERWNPARLLQQMGWYLQANFKRFLELPVDIQRVLRRLEDRDLGVRLQHEGVEPLARSLASALNRISIAILAGLLVLASAALHFAQVPPSLGEMTSLPAVASLASGTVLAVWLVFDLLRSQRW